MNKKEQEIITRFAVGREIELAEVKPEDWAMHNLCYENVLEKIKRDGGAFACGYVFFRWSPGVMDAVPHVVWRSDKEILIDVTPQVFVLGTYCVSVGDKKMFLGDDAAKPVIVKERVVEYRADGSIRRIHHPGDWVCPPSKSFAMTRTARREVAQMNRADYEATRAIMRAADLALAV